MGAHAADVRRQRSLRERSIARVEQRSPGAGLPGLRRPAPGPPVVDVPRPLREDLGTTASVGVRDVPDMGAGAVREPGACLQHHDPPLRCALVHGPRERRADRAAPDDEHVDVEFDLGGHAP